MPVICLHFYWLQRSLWSLLTTALPFGSLKLSTMQCWLRSLFTISMETMLTWVQPVENTSVSAVLALLIQVIRISSRLHQVTSKEEMPVPLGIGVLSFSSVVVDLSGLVLSPYIVLNTICLPVIWVFGNSLALKILFLELTLSMELCPMVVLNSEFSSLVIPVRAIVMSWSCGNFF